MPSEFLYYHPDIAWVAKLCKHDTVYVRNTKDDSRSIGLVSWRSDHIRVVYVKWFSLYSYNMAQTGCFCFLGRGKPLTGSHFKLEQYCDDMGREVDARGLGQGVVE